MKYQDMKDKNHQLIAQLVFDGISEEIDSTGLHAAIAEPILHIKWLARGVDPEQLDIKYIAVESLYVIVDDKLTITSINDIDGCRSMREEYGDAVQSLVLDVPVVINAEELIEQTEQLGEVVEIRS